MDYKDILRNKANQLRALVAKYGESLDADTLNNMNVLINNTIQITDGRLDSLDYDVRNEGIMNYHNKLDSAMRTLKSRFEEKDKNQDTQK